MMHWTWGYIYIFKLVLLFSSGNYPEVELLDHMVVLFLIFEDLLYYFPLWPHRCTFSPATDAGFTSPHPLQHLLFSICCCYQYVAFLVHLQRHLVVVLICCCLMTLSIFSRTCLLWENVLSFLTGVSFLLLNCRSSLYILGIKLLYQINDFQIFSPILQVIF